MQLHAIQTYLDKVILCSDFETIKMYELALINEIYLSLGDLLIASCYSNRNIQ